MESKTLISSIRENIGKVMVGSEETIDLLLTALIAEGHVLIEDVPGMGKTVLAKSLAKSVSLSLTASSSRPTCFPATSRASTTSTRKQTISFSAPARHSATYSSPMRSTAPHRARSRACSSAWASARSPWTASPVRFRRRFSSSPRRTPSKRSAPIPCRKPSSTAF